MRRRAVLAALAVVCVSEDAAARGVQRRFDPDDLQIDDVGVLHADLAFGVARGEDAGRWLVPDFDVDIGLTSNVELGVDGALAFDGRRGALYAFDHLSPDNLWISSKVGLWDRKDELKRTGWAMGLQIGPRLALAPGAHGTGFQGIALFGHQVKRLRTVLNLGGLVEPGDTISTGRPIAVLTGLDGQLDLDAKGTWSLQADVSGIFFVTDDKSQLGATFGPVLAVTPWLDVSVDALVGVLAGGNHYGGFLQLTPKIPIF